MDILSHTFSGIAVGTVLASFSKGGFKTKSSIILISGFGGALPDLDAISMWSNFDSTIGNFFNLSHSGSQIYTGKWWYSHHGALHSLTFAVIIPFVFLFLKSLKPLFQERSLSRFTQKIALNKLKILGFILGFGVHLIEDMPTPAAYWGGVNLFWPSKTYSGGFGKIWWWNNYDIFLVIIGVIVLNIITLGFSKWLNAQKITPFIFLLGFSLSLFQMNTREFDFNYTGGAKHYQAYEQKSKEIQKEILGEKLYLMMKKFDDSMKLNF